VAEATRQQKHSRHEQLIFHINDINTARRPGRHWIPDPQSSSLDSRPTILKSPSSCDFCEGVAPRQRQLLCCNCCSVAVLQLQRLPATSRAYAVPPATTIASGWTTKNTGGMRQGQWLGKRGLKAGVGKGGAETTTPLPPHPKLQLANSRRARGANISNAIDRQCRELLWPQPELKVKMGFRIGDTLSRQLNITRLC